MAIQIINLGSTPTGAGGDTFRSTGVKVNENFRELYDRQAQLGSASNHNVGAGLGDVVRVGDCGLAWYATDKNPDNLTASGFFHTNTANASAVNYLMLVHAQHNTQPGYCWQMGIAAGDENVRNLKVRVKNNGVWSGVATVLTSHNTATDSNGFIKAASPILKIFAEKIEANEEASKQNPTFEKINVGHYLLKNTEGFSDNGWYIEMPKDANGNVLVAVQYQQLEDDTIEVKTFAKKFDEETGDIVPNLEKPRDIPTGRWIDIRLKALLQPEIKISDTPIDFQPTNLAQAVSEALKDDAE